MPGLFRNNEKTPEGKYLVTRRDGTVPDWPYFVIGAKDPAAYVALRAYAEECARLKMDPHYVTDVCVMADEFKWFLANEGAGDPDGAPHRTDDPATIEKMRGNSE